MSSKDGIRCPACGKKVAEALEGSLTVTCPRSTCGATFSLTVCLGWRTDGGGGKPIDIRLLQADTVNQ